MPGRRGPGQIWRRLRIVLFLLLLVVFVAFRWWVRAEPLNSDDAVLFSASVAAVEGEHWLFSPPTQRSREENLRHQSHHWLRIGVLPVSIPLIRLFGPTQLSYYLYALLFALAGFVLTWRIMDREVDSRLALIFALLHVGFLFEVMEGTVFLVDLPAAVAMLATLYLVAVLSERRPASRPALFLPAAGALVALPLLLGYLLRSNSLVLLVPGLAVFLFVRSSRGMVLWSLPWTVAGVFAEQGLYVAKGYGFGFRWERVDRALEGYSKYLPWYDLSDFPWRELTTLWKIFGGGFDATFLLALYLLMLVGLVGMLVRGASPLLRAVAITGLASWGVFSFAFFDVEAGRVHAMAPVNFRYFQPFYYAGIIALCWSSRQLLRRLPPADGRAAVRRRPAVWLAAVVGGWVLVTSFVLTLEHGPVRLSSPDSSLRLALEAIDQAAEAEPASPLDIHGTYSWLRVIQLFRGPWSDPPVVWHRSGVAALAESVAAPDGARPVVLVDERRLSRNARYLRGERAARFAEIVETLRIGLWENYTQMSYGSRYGVYVPLRDGERKEGPPELVFEAGAPGPETPVVWQTTGGVRLVPGAAGGVAVRASLQSDHFYVYSGDGRGLSVPPDPLTSFSLQPGGRYEVLVRLALDPGVEARLYLVEYGRSQRLATRAWTLSGGLDMITFSPHPEAWTGRLALRFGLPSPRPEDGPPTIEVRSLRLRTARGDRPGVRVRR